MPNHPSKEESLVNDLKQKMENKVNSLDSKPKRIIIKVDVKNIIEIAKTAKDMGFDQVISVAGTDYPEDDQLEVIYHIASLSDSKFRDIVLSISARLPRSDPKVPTLFPIWKSCDWHERETHEMLGIEFDGHPDLGRVLLPEDWNEIPPLRKDYVLPGR